MHDKAPSRRSFERHQPSVPRFKPRRRAKTIGESSLALSASQIAIHSVLLRRSLRIAVTSLLCRTTAFCIRELLGQFEVDGHQALGRKIITDTIKMVGYCAETQLANLVGPLLPYRGDEARKFMRQVFELPADLLPDDEQQQLVVRLHSMATPRDNRALASLCAVLNGLDLCYPGTNLTLVLETTLAPIELR